MTVTLDDSLCCGFGNCVAVCPEVFGNGDEGMQVVDAEPAPGLLDAVRQAERECPTAAISVVDEESSCVW